VGAVGQMKVLITCIKIEVLLMNFNAFTRNVTALDDATG